MTSTYEHVLTYCHCRLGVKPFRAVACGIILALAGSNASAKPKHRQYRPTTGMSVSSVRPATGITGSGLPFSSDDDALYRAHGYGIGGVPFSLGGGPDLALSGACAQVANRNPACGPAGGYGIYGNGLGYGPGAR